MKKEKKRKKKAKKKLMDFIFRSVLAFTEKNWIEILKIC